MTTAIYQNCQYLISAAKLSQLPGDRGYEVAFAGRSNAGKSSAVNAITGRGTLARTSKTPGRTRLLNFFRLDDDRRLVDLPGYGFAKVPIPVKLQWASLVESYLRQRTSLAGVIVVMDVRRPLTDLDWQMVAWCEESNVPIHVLLTKADKLSRAAGHRALATCCASLKDVAGAVTAQLFSATKRTGLETVHTKLAQWLVLPASD